LFSFFYDVVFSLICSIRLMYHVTVTTWEEICLNDVMISINKMFHCTYFSSVVYAKENLLRRFRFHAVKYQLPTSHYNEANNFSTTSLPCGIARHQRLPNLDCGFHW